MQLERIQVLLIEDNPGDARLIQEMLRDNPTIIFYCGRSLREGIDFLQTKSVDIILLDLGLPDSHGFDTFYRIKEHVSNTPIVVLTGNRDEEIGEKAVQEGAQDFYIKGEVQDYALRRAIKYAMERFEIHEKLDHLNHVLMAIRNVNKLIVHEKNPSKLIQKICDTLVENRGYKAVWVILEDEVGNPSTATQCGWDDHFHFVEEMVAAEKWLHCRQLLMESGGDIIRINPAEQCDGCPLQSHYKENNSIVKILKHGNKTFGILGISVSSKIVENEYEKSLINEVAYDIAFALNSIDLEERERKSEERFQRLYRNMVQGVVFQDAEGKIIHANHAAETILGLSLEQMQGRSSIDERWRAIREDGSNLPGDEHFSMITLRTGQSMNGVMGVVNAETGQNTWIKVHAVPEYDESRSRPIGVFTTFEDITEKRLAEVRLAESVEKYRAMVQNIGMGVVMIDRDMRILEMNRQMRDWYPDIDLSMGPICYREFRKPDRDRVCDDCPTLKTLETGLPCETVVDINFGEKSRKFRIAASPIRDSNGEIVAAIEMVEDITERLSLEEQLRQSQKLEAIGQLAGGVAHDFNNMLGVIIGYGELMLDSIHESDPLCEFVKEIIKAGKSSAGLTRQLLAFSRKQALQVQIVDLNELMKNLTKMLCRLIGEDIDYETHLAKDIALVEVDPGQVEQVIINLAVNARDAMPQGGKLIIGTKNCEVDDKYVNAHFEVEKGHYVMLTISDNGVGMSEETREKIFEPFFTTKGKGKGTGLGLSTVYGIVRQLGGVIMAYSEVGVGTSFKILLPASQSVMEEQKKVDFSRGVQSTAGLKILVVEDDDSLRNLIKRALLKIKWEIRTAANGGAALLEIEEKGFEPDIILTDIVMPEMSGKVLINRLRKKIPDMKVVYMSGYTDNAIVHHGMLDPDTPFIQKPFNMQDLIGKIEETLGG